MFCKKCGSSLDENALFCSNCGCSIKEAMSNKKKKKIIIPIILSVVLLAIGGVWLLMSVGNSNKADKAIIGSWELSAMQGNNESVLTKEEYESSKGSEMGSAQFKTDKTYELSILGSEFSGSWEVDEENSTDEMLVYVLKDKLGANFLGMIKKEDGDLGINMNVDSDSLIFLFERE